MPRLPLLRLHPLMIAALLALPAPGLAAEKAAGKNAWVLNFQYGAGNLDMAGDTLGRDFGLLSRLRLSHILDNGIVTGFEARSWSDSEIDDLRDSTGIATRPVERTRSVVIITLTATKSLKGRGLYMRGGAGVCTVKHDFVKHGYLVPPPRFPSVAVTLEDVGFSASGAVGWEQRIGRRLGAALDFEYARFVAAHVGGNLMTYTAGLNYYW